MKNQYFADRRDLFKYDLLLDLAEHVHKHRLLLIPMLTPDDGSGEGRLTTYASGNRRRVVYDFLCKAVSSGDRNVRLLRDLMPTCGVEFMTYRDDSYFTDDARRTYFDSVPTEWLARSIIFLDPDIGIETGTPGYMRRSGPEKYLMYADLMSLAKRATDDSVLVVYQHLQNDARKRATDVERRLHELTARLGVRCAYAVQWDDLAFLVLTRDVALGQRVAVTLEEHARRHNVSMFSDRGSVHSGDGESVRTVGATQMVKTLPPLPPIRDRKIDGSAFGLHEIVRFLNHEKVRATYGAVAELVGGIPQSIGARLGSRRAEASWIVNASSGMPTGYQLHERHPALLSKTEIIKSGDELQRRLVRWRAAAR